MLPVWREAYRVLRSGGVLLAGFSNPINYIFDLDLLDREHRLEVKFKLPYSDMGGLSDRRKKAYLAKGWPLEFSHTLDDQIGGQGEAVFLIAGFFEDRYPPQEDDLMSSAGRPFSLPHGEVGSDRGDQAMLEPNAWVIGLNEIIRLRAALFIGGLIGIDRELHYKAPGAPHDDADLRGVHAVHHVFDQDRRSWRCSRHSPRRS